MSDTNARIDQAQVPSAWATVRRGLDLSPEFRQGLGLTLLLALLATAGRTLVPIAVQQTIDRDLVADAGALTANPISTLVLVALVGVALTAAAAYAMNVRLVRAAEHGLSTLRVRAFRHVHDLSVLTQDAERRGSLVSRVTSDVDTLSTFLQSGGLLLLVSAGQLVVATVVMAVYSWQLTLLVWAAFLPFFFFLRTGRRAIAAAYGRVRMRVGELLAAISEAVLGAHVVKAFGIEDRTAKRIDVAVTAHYDSLMNTQRWVGASTAVGDLAWGLTNALLVIVGVRLGLAGEVTAGELLAFLFLVTLFVAPVQMGVEMLNEAQNAVAGWRRVLAVLDTATDVADPGPGGVDLPPGRLDVRLDDVRFAYPDGPEVLHGVSVHLPAGARVAVVGQTGSGKTTFAKLLVRLMDPSAGDVRLDSVDLRTVRFASLRRRTLLIPQEGFLFDGTLRANLVRYLDDDAQVGLAGDESLLRAIDALGLRSWFDGLPAGLDTEVGQRGESLSVGERQLVCLVGASLADPDLLVLDEATSAVDPATEMRLQAALSSLTRGRTSVTIAHRLSTAEDADEVLVFEDGHLAEQGRHAALVARGGTYSRLHAAWQVATAPTAT